MDVAPSTNRKLPTCGTLTQSDRGLAFLGRAWRSRYKMVSSSCSPTFFLLTSYCHDSNCPGFNSWHRGRLLLVYLCTRSVLQWYKSGYPPSPTCHHAFTSPPQTETGFSLMETVTLSHGSRESACSIMLGVLFDSVMLFLIFCGLDYQLQVIDHHFVFCCCSYPKRAKKSTH